MILGVARFELRLLGRPSSLKGKRAVILGLKDRIRSRLRISAAEVGGQDLLQRATLGVACVGSDAEAVRRVLRGAEQILEREPELEILDREIEVGPW